MIAVYYKSDVAQLLGESVRSFDRNRRAREVLGFPRPLPGRTRPRWSKVQVDAWLETGGRTPAANVAAIDDWKARLAERTRSAA